MITVDLDVATLGRVRLASSPVYEIAMWLRLAAVDTLHPLFGDLGPESRAALSHPDVGLLALVMREGRSGYMPDLLTPKPLPGRPGQGLDSQLQRIRETPGEVVCRQLTEESFVDRAMPVPVRRAMESGTFAGRAANGLHRYWRAVMADRWSSLRAALEGDLTRRTALMAGHGVGAVLDSLHASAAWTGRDFVMDKSHEARVELRDTELVLCPTVLGWSWLTFQLTDPADAMVSYPAYGLDLNGHRPGPALGSLVGASRAAVLRDLDVPRSTKELSGRHSLAPATVSYHLGVLLRAGLVRRSRHRNTVLYQRSEDGETLNRLDA